MERPNFSGMSQFQGGSASSAPQAGSRVLPSLSPYIYIPLSLSLYIYIYIEREREREREILVLRRALALYPVGGAEF